MSYNVKNEFWLPRIISSLSSINWSKALLKATEQLPQFSAGYGLSSKCLFSNTNARNIHDSTQAPSMYMMIFKVKGICFSSHLLLNWSPPLQTKCGLKVGHSVPAKHSSRINLWGHISKIAKHFRIIIDERLFRDIKIFHFNGRELPLWTENQHVIILLWVKFHLKKYKCPWLRSWQRSSYTHGSALILDIFSWLPAILHFELFALWQMRRLLRFCTQKGSVWSPFLPIPKYGKTLAFIII